MTTMEQLWEHISSLMTGYEHQFFFLSDRNPNSKLCVIRPQGGPRPVPKIIGYPSFQVWLVGSGKDQLTNYRKCLEIIDYIGGNWSSGGVPAFRVLSEPQGPFLLDQGRHYFELNINAMINR